MTSLAACTEPVRPIIRTGGPDYARSLVLLFEPGSTELTPRAQFTAFGMLYNFLVPLAGQPMRVEGHCDGAEESRGGLRLSRKRAEAVLAFLALNGVPSDRITVTAFGASRPMIPTARGAPQQENRRVEVWV
ncbi:OmpA family protein [Roseomonas sp. WA12]